MREDMQYIGGVLQEMEAIVDDASQVPMRRGRVVVDRSDLLVMLDELRDSMPREFEEAETVRKECEDIIEAGREEARKIVEQAREQADTQALETDHYQRSQRHAAEMVEQAEQYAREVASGAEAYRDRILGQLEDWFEESMGAIVESRRELDKQQQERQPTQAFPVYEDNGQRHWRAS
jgi:cell division septum initiation protein DivIVA